jgi:integrase
MSVKKEGKYYWMNFMVNGRRIHRSTRMTNRKEALLVEAQTRMQLKKESVLPPELRKKEIKLSEALDLTYKNKWYKNNDGLKTYERCKKIIKILGDKKISELKTSDVNTLRDKLCGEGLKPATVNRYIACFKVILRTCAKEGDIRMPDPMPAFEFFDETPGRIRTVSKEEELKIIKTLREQGYPDMAELVIVLVDVGARLSNILKLDRKDINFETGFIHFWKNKSKKVGYQVPMTPRVKEILERRCKNGPRPFPMTINQVEHAWRRIRKKLNLTGDDGFVLHCLRHTFCTRLINQNVSLYVVKELAGHRCITTTERYAHVQPGTLKEAIKLLG